MRQGVVNLARENHPVVGQGAQVWPDLQLWQTAKLQGLRQFVGLMLRDADVDDSACVVAAPKPYNRVCGHAGLGIVDGDKHRGLPPG